MEQADGGLTEYCEVISVVEQHEVDPGVYYLPDYTPKMPHTSHEVDLNDNRPRNFEELGRSLQEKDLGMENVYVDTEFKSMALVCETVRDVLAKVAQLDASAKLANITSLLTDLLIAMKTTHPKIKNNAITRLKAQLPHTNK